MKKVREKTYGQLMIEARAKTERQEVGETLEGLMDRFKQIIEDAVQANFDKGVRGRYYIHIWVNKEPYADNSLHIYPQCRRTRPSPYQSHDHYLWSVDDGGVINFQWCIPKKEVVAYILSHPYEFDGDYVRMLKGYCQDKIEKIEDYLVEGKIA